MTGTPSRLDKALLGAVIFAVCLDMAASYAAGVCAAARRPLEPCVISGWPLSAAAWNYTRFAKEKLCAGCIAAMQNERYMHGRR